MIDNKNKKFNSNGSVWAGKMQITYQSLRRLQLADVLAVAPGNIINQVAKHVAYNGTEYQQDGNHNDGHQHQDQSVLDKSLSFFTR